MFEIFKAVVGISMILGGWIAVQAAWRRHVGAAPCQDALAGRLGCHGCGCQLGDGQQEQRAAETSNSQFKQLDRE